MSYTMNEVAIAKVDKALVAMTEELSHSEETFDSHTDVGAVVVNRILEEAAGLELSLEPEFGEDALAHYGVKGMKWRVRKAIGNAKDAYNTARLRARGMAGRALNVSRRVQDGYDAAGGRKSSKAYRAWDNINRYGYSRDGKTSYYDGKRNRQRGNTTREQAAVGSELRSGIERRRKVQQKNMIRLMQRQQAAALASEAKLRANNLNSYTKGYKAGRGTTLEGKMINKKIDAETKLNKKVSKYENKGRKLKKLGKQAYNIVRHGDDEYNAQIISDFEELDYILENLDCMTPDEFAEATATINRCEAYANEAGYDLDDIVLDEYDY